MEMVYSIFRYIDAREDVTNGEKLEKIGEAFGFESRRNKKQSCFYRKWGSFNFQRGFFGCKDCADMYLTDPAEYGKSDADGRNRSGIGNFDFHSKRFVMRQVDVMSY